MNKETKRNQTENYRLGNLSRGCNNQGYILREHFEWYSSKTYILPAFAVGTFNWSVAEIACYEKPVYDCQITFAFRIPSGQGTIEVAGSQEVSSGEIVTSLTHVCSWKVSKLDHVVGVKDDIWQALLYLTSNDCINIWADRRRTSCLTVL